MAVSPKILKAHGCDPKLWKQLFAPKDPKDKPREIKKLELLIQNRVSDGQLRCISQYRTWAAVDLAYDVTFAQTSPTIIQSLMGKKWENTEQLMAELKQWNINLDEIFLDGVDSRGNPGKYFNAPTFYKIFVPLVKAYITIRWAKLFNDRNKTPLFKYEPMQPNQENRILCEILTYLVQVMTADFNYNSMVKDAIFQTLMYSICLSFPRDVWTREKQYELDEDGKEKEVIQKEGLRYELPHPSLMFWDLDYPVYTLNSDTGCEYAGYWKVVRYGDVLDNPNYWNRRNISYSGKGVGDFISQNNYFQELFPCRLEFPTGVSGTGTSRELNAIVYSSNQRDLAVTQTDLFMKLVPKKWKLGTYPHPIWTRWIVASDNTVIYGEPCAYCPVKYSGYDANSLRSKNSSMALEVLPFQDQVGNLLSQILLTAKQNLLRVNFYDKNQIDGDDLDKMKNRGELKYRDMIFIPYDTLKNARAGLDPTKAIISAGFEKGNIQELFQTITTVLGILERLLQLSSQESGQAGSHQQSKAEVDLIGSSTSNRVQFTGSFIDDFMDATKFQLHDALLAYAQDTVEAAVPSDIPDIEEHLEKMGFEIINKVEGEGKLMVRGSKKLIKIDALAVSSHTPERKNDSQTAQVMMQAIGSLVKNEDMLKAVGVKPILKLIEKAAILAGADKDFRLRPDQKQEVAALQAMAEQIQIAAAKHVEEEVAKPVAKEIAVLQANIKTLDDAMAKVIQTLKLDQPAGQPPAQPTPGGGVVGTPPSAPPNAQPPAQPVVNRPAGPPVQAPAV